MFASACRFRDNTETVLEGRKFNVPVLKTSTLKYPPFVDKTGRTVMIAANASSVSQMQ